MTKKIEVKKIKGLPDGKFEVVVQAEKTTVHRVTLSQDYYQKLTKGNITPEEFIRRSFKFLLDREPNTSILTRFDLSTISSYFPEYEVEIQPA